MADATRLTNLEVAGSLELSGLTKSSYTVSSANAAEAAGSAPTAAEFKKTVDLCNELKSKLNALVTKLCDG